MPSKSRFPTFIDSLVVEFTELPDQPVRLVLKDERGEVCSSLETSVPQHERSLRWGGFSDLPYGVYYIECSADGEGHRHRIVKRV